MELLLYFDVLLLYRVNFQKSFTKIYKELLLFLSHKIFAIINPVVKSYSNSNKSNDVASTFQNKQQNKNAHTHAYCFGVIIWKMSYTTTKKDRVY